MVSPRILKDGFDRLFAHFGPRNWWPGETPFEVMVGAILTQNTNWKNVERAILNLKEAKVLTPQKINKMSHAELARLIRPAGYFTVKATRLKNFIKYFIKKYDGNVSAMARGDLSKLREELLSVNGIGPETADSILLYALNKPIFVVDAYTKRMLLRHSLCTEDDLYHDIQSLFMDGLPEDAKLFNEYHALIVETGKNFCKKNPLCQNCPLNGWNLS